MKLSNSRANYLASPPLAVVYALIGNVGVDINGVIGKLLKWLFKVSNNVISDLEELIFTLQNLLFRLLVRIRTIGEGGTQTTIFL